MSYPFHPVSQAAVTAFKSAAQEAAPAARPVVTAKPASRRKIPPLVIRLTEEERARLEELAVGMTLSSYARACLFGEEAKRRKRRPKDALADKRAAAEALALLGQSRIASNLNQLAYHANIGALIVGESEKAEIAQANAHLAAIRALLIEALGKTPRRKTADRAR